MEEKTLIRYKQLSAQMEATYLKKTDGAPSVNYELLFNEVTTLLDADQDCLYPLLQIYLEITP